MVVMKSREAARLRGRSRKKSAELEVHASVEAVENDDSDSEADNNEMSGTAAAANALDRRAIIELYEGGRRQQAAGPQPRFILMPSSGKLLAWELTSCLLLLYTSISIPLRLAFFDVPRWDLQESWTYLDTLVDLFFIADMLSSATFALAILITSAL